MQIGCCTGMGTKDSWGVGYEHISELAELGFDYVEMPLTQVTSMPEAAFRDEVLPRLKDIPCLACNNFFPGTVRLTGPSQDMAQVIEYVGRAFARAEAMGTKVIVLGSSGARTVPPDFPVREGFRQMAEVLAAIAPIAKQHGLSIALEPLNQMETNLINTYSSGLYLAALSGQENVGSLVDAYHFLLGNENLADLLMATPMHVHVAETCGRRVPHTRLSPPLAAFLDTLVEAGYDGAVSLEGGAGDDFRRGVSEAMRLLRDHFSR